MGLQRAQKVECTKYNSEGKRIDLSRPMWRMNLNF